MSEKEIKAVESLKQKLGEDVFNEDLQALVTKEIENKINEKINDARVDEREKASKEYEQEIEKFKENKQKEIDEIKEDLNKISEKDEKIEELEKKLENVKGDDEIKEAIENGKEEAEDVAVEIAAKHIKEYKEQVDEQLDEKIKQIEEDKRQYKEEMIESVDKYLDIELENLLPEDVNEAIVKVATYEPLIESIKSAFADSGIDLDDEQLGIVEEAYNKINDLKDKVNGLMNEKLDLKVELEQYESQDIIDEICEGLTERQAKRFKRLARPFDVEQLKERKNELVDAVIESDVGKNENRRPKRRIERPSTQSAVGNLDEGVEKTDDIEKGTRGVSVIESYRKDFDDRFNRKPVGKDS